VWHAVRYAFVPEKRAAMIREKRAGLVSVPFDRRQATRFGSVAAAARRRPGPFLFFFWVRPGPFLPRDEIVPISLIEKESTIG